FISGETIPMKIKVGIIGAGAIANDHCKNLLAHPDAEVVAVADLSRERREQVKKEHGLTRAYESWEKLVADPDLDAIAIALPNVLHAPAALAAIAAGKHVLLEKPFAMNYAEAKKVADAAAKKKRVLMIGMNQRYSKDAQTLRELVRRGELGEVYHTKTYWYRRQGSPKFGTWFVNKKLSGGGCLLDIGVHYLDLALHLIDNWAPVSVSGQIYGKFGHRGLGEGGWGKSDRVKSLKFDVDDFATGLIKFKNGATMELNVSWILHQETPNRNNVELYGTDAGASLNPLKLFRAGRRTGEYEATSPQNVTLKTVYTNRQANWIDAILGKAKPLCEVRQSLVVQKILDSIYKSSATGREVRLS
ncbi:MAG: Gfo/Idh/MocA family oxidoreductase, partial [Kiritimatiellia bacterium]|nr:Gfo/Idh/MocA family oxidoreductase [Kiritimatiellia bacterium]